MIFLSSAKAFIILQLCLKRLYPITSDWPTTGINVTGSHIRKPQRCSEVMTSLPKSRYVQCKAESYYVPSCYRFEIFLFSTVDRLSYVIIPVQIAYSTAEQFYLLSSGAKALGAHCAALYWQQLLLKSCTRNTGVLLTAAIGFLYEF
jgi:hypothetical protein